MTENKTEIKRTYTIPLRRGYANTPRHKRTNKAVRVLKKYLVKHMKSEKVKLGPKLNDLLWVNGIKNPPGKVTVDVTKDENNVVRAELSGIAYVDFKQQDKTAAAPKNLQDKLKQSVADVKASKKDAPKAEAKAQSKEAPKVSKEKPAAPKTENVKVEAKKETPAPKVEVKKEATPVAEKKAE